MINKRKIVITVIAGGLLLLLYSMIFSFSAQDSEESGSLSRLLSEKCVEIINNLSGRKWSETVMKSMAEYFEHPIRKFAHFAEYACMAILVYVIWAQWMERGKRLYFLTVFWVFVSGAADEFHQLFVPGRYGSIGDALIDTLGGACGLLICICCTRISRYARRA